MITVYGATGYTGQQIARALVEQGHAVTLAGRARSGLEAFSNELGGAATVQVAGIEDRAALAELATNTSVIINCAGPFVRTCRPIAEAAVAGNAHYVDISAEQLGSRWCYTDGDALARAAGVALLPSFGFYSVLADLLAEQACTGIGSISEITVAYWIDAWRPTGTSLAARFEAMGQPWFDHDHGVANLRKGMPRTSFFDFPAPIGRRRVGLYPVAEVFTIPWHINVDRLTTRLTASTLAPRPLERALPMMANVAGAVMRTPARSFVERVIAAMWHASAVGVAQSDPTRFMVAVDARGKSGMARTWLSGRGIYDITAPITAQAAVLVSQGGVERVGTVAPAHVFKLDSLVSELRGFDLEYGATANRSGAPA